MLSCSPPTFSSMSTVNVLPARIRIPSRWNDPKPGKLGGDTEDARAEDCCSR